MKKILSILLLLINFSIFSQTPIINFTFPSDTVDIGDEVVFTNTSTGFNVSTKFYWTYGENCYNFVSSYSPSTVFLCKDSTIGTSQLVYHNFATLGYLTINLNCKDPAGITYSIDKTIFIKTPIPIPASNCEHVPNGGFNNFNLCTTPLQPWGFPFGMNNVNGWYSILSTSGTIVSTPDYDISQTCTNSVTGATIVNNLVPNNYFGCQSNITQGNAYAGIFTSVASFANYREYIRVNLTQPLIQYRQYRVSYWVSLAEVSRSGCIPPQPYFSSNIPTQATNAANISIPSTNTISVNSYGVITDKVNWIEISGIYTPQTIGQKYLTIGNFFNDANTLTTNLSLVNCSSSMTSSYGVSAYFYIDSVSVKPVLPDLNISVSDTAICQLQSISLTSDTTVTWSAFPTTPLVVFSCNPCDSTTIVPASIDTITYYASLPTGIANCVNIDSLQIEVEPAPQCILPIIPPYEITNGATVTSVFGGATTITGQNIRINGTFTIDQNLTIYNSNIIMGENSKIIVNSGKSLTIHDKSHFYACCYMWEGIDVYGTARFFGSSVVEDAKNAVKIFNGGLVTIDNSIFNRNHTSINIQANSGSSSPVVITHSLFTSRNLGLSTDLTLNPLISTVLSNLSAYAPINLKYPYQAEKGVYGIYATDVNTLTIGNSSSAGAINTFDELKIGVFINKSNASIYNNLFKNFKVNGFCAFCTNNYGTAIKAAGTTTGNYSVTIGGTTTLYQGNTFENCYRAMELFDYKTYSIVKNSITNISSTVTTGFGNSGIYIKPSANNTINLKENTIVNCNSAIWINRANSSAINSVEINVDHNTILANTTGFCTIGVNFVDISNTSSTTPTDKIKIQYNSISQAYNCISATNVKNSLVIRSNNQLELRNNGTAVNAIKLSNCKGVKIHDNQNINILPVPTPVNTANINYKGIFVSSSTENQITCNKISNMGESMTFRGSCINSTLRNNTLDKGNRGFVLRNNGEVGAQGTTSLPCGLWWESNASSFTAHTYTDTTTNANTNSKLYINSTGAPAGFTGIPTANSGGVPYSVGSGGLNTASGSPIVCSNVIILMAPVGGGGTSTISSTTTANETTLLTTLATDENVYPVYEDAHQYSHKKYAFDKLQVNGIITNATLQNFYDSTQVEAMGKLTQVDNAIKLSDAALASALNNSVSTNNVVEANQKVFNALYLNYLNNNEYVFTQIEKDELLAIAEQCPLEGGSAVWQARVLYSTLENNWIEFADNCNATVRQMAVDNAPAVEIQTDNRFNLYPNPNNGQMILEYTLNENQTAVLSIYDITGKSINTYSLNNKNKSLTINENNLDAGMYYYQITVNNKSVKSDKLIIIK